jgi:hypothetical protein
MEMEMEMEMEMDGDSDGYGYKNNITQEEGDLQGQVQHTLESFLKRNLYRA